MKRFIVGIWLCMFACILYGQTGISIATEQMELRLAVSPKGR